MKKEKFKEANSKCGYIYISNENNTVIMKFKPTFKEVLKMLVSYFFPCVSVWVGAPIRTAHGQFSIKVQKTAFIEE